MEARSPLAHALVASPPTEPSPAPSARYAHATGYSHATSAPMCIAGRQPAVGATAGGARLATCPVGWGAAPSHWGTAVTIREKRSGLDAATAAVAAASASAGGIDADADGGPAATGGRCGRLSSRRLPPTSPSSVRQQAHGSRWSATPLPQSWSFDELLQRGGGGGPSTAVATANAAPVPSTVGSMSVDRWGDVDGDDDCSGSYDENEDEDDDDTAPVGSAGFVPPHLLENAALHSGCSVGRDPTPLSSRHALRRLANWM